MSVQRRRGQKARVFKQVETTDSRGNIHYMADMDAPVNVAAAFIPERSSKAEVPGQVEIDVVRMIVRPDIDDVGTWSLVEWRGRMWDIIAPPSYHHGTRHTRHWSLILRGRPHDG